MKHLSINCETKKIAYVQVSKKEEEAILAERAANDVPDKWNEIKNKARILLRKSDSAVIKELEENGFVSSELKSYRNALRNITTDYENPDDVVFPVKISKSGIT